ncbi:MAG: S-methyl-5-thioribose-1-phosphate isomerase [Pseudomonadales bacterium]|nr:S-methyl-5-thioribose-1-phosphate isomerase [Pseudomonadales bacterium]
MLSHLLPLDPLMRMDAAWAEAGKLCNEDVQNNSAIGDHGLKLIEQIASSKPQHETVNILTHCNAGWLATVDWGTATSPIYKAFDKGISVHVYVSETRPRNQGAYLTAWELGQHGVPHTLVVDNAGGHLMQQNKIDLVLVGSDRTTNQGDVCNKIGTYLKALAAVDNNIPFYVAVPTSSIDFSIEDGLKEITIEERGDDEVKVISGLDNKGEIHEVRISPENTAVSNPAFDVTPGRLVTGLITEKGIFNASPSGLKLLKQSLLS